MNILLKTKSTLFEAIFTLFAPLILQIENHCFILMMVDIDIVESASGNISPNIGLSTSKTISLK